MALLVILALWFFVIALFADRRYRYSAIILLVASACNAIMISVGIFEPMSYIEAKQVLIKFDGVVAVVLISFLIKYKNARRLSILAVFAVFCHAMVIHHLEIGKSGFFYTYYDQLIVTISVLQMLVTKDGLVNAYKNAIDTFNRKSIQIRICHIYFICYREDWLVHLQSGART